LVHQEVFWPNGDGKAGFSETHYGQKKIWGMGLGSSDGNVKFHRGGSAGGIDRHSSG